MTGLLGPERRRQDDPAAHPRHGARPRPGRGPLRRPVAVGRRGRCTRSARELGYAPQEPGFYPNFTVFEFVDYLAILKEMTDRRARHDEVRRVISPRRARRGRRRKPIRKLSGGMRRRTALAQALLGDPTLVVLDEPTAGLDPEQRLRFRELLSKRTPDQIVLLSTHQTEDVTALCQRVVVIDRGRTLFDGTPADARRHGSGPGVALRPAPSRRAELSWIDGLGPAPPHRRRRRRGRRSPSPTLEDGYLLLVGRHPGADERDAGATVGLMELLVDRRSSSVPSCSSCGPDARPRASTFKPAGAFHPPRRSRGPPGIRWSPSLALARREGAAADPASGLRRRADPVHAADAAHRARGGDRCRRAQPGRRLADPDARAPRLGRDPGRRTCARCAAGATAPTSCSAGRRCPLGSRTAAHLLACLATLPVSVGVRRGAGRAAATLEGWQGWPRIEVFARRAADRARRRGARRGRRPVAAVGGVRVGRGDRHVRAAGHLRRGRRPVPLAALQQPRQRHDLRPARAPARAPRLAPRLPRRRHPARRRRRPAPLAAHRPPRRAAGRQPSRSCALGIIAQVQPPTAARPPRSPPASRSPIADQECDEVDGVTYCSWPRYAAWREGWRAPVEGVLSRRARSGRDRPGGFVVSQRPTCRCGPRRSRSAAVVDPRLVFPREPVVHASFDWTEPTWSHADVEQVRDFDWPTPPRWWPSGSPTARGGTSRPPTRRGRRASCTATSPATRSRCWTAV